MGSRRAVRVVVRVVVLGLASVASACSVLTATDDLASDDHGGTTDGASPDGGAGGVDGGASGADGAASEGGSGADAPSSGDASADVASARCPSTGGPVPVAIDLPDGGHYCIDATEVTRAQYKQFLAAAPSPDPHPRCGWNTTFTPAVSLDGDALPVMGVDWCDAHAFCRWAGKRLCGRVGGGSQTLSVSTTNAEWVYACSAGGTRAYPYGAAFQATACNGAGYGAGAPVDVASAAGCEGGFPGLFDMSGNVAEWVDACDQTSGSGEADTCAFLNAGYEESFGPDLSCTKTRSAARNAASFVGFRCCGP